MAGLVDRSDQECKNAIDIQPLHHLANPELDQVRPSGTVICKANTQ